MTQEDLTGGGASVSTTPATGTSAATDVSLREYISSQINWMDRFYKSEILHVKELADSRRAGDQLAIKIALENQQELAEKHNDLIRSGEKKDENYATKTDVGRIERWQFMITGGLVLLGAIGLTNLIKIWTG